MARAELQKRYEYKIFSPASVYIGLLPSNLIVSEFSYNLLIGTAFVQTQIVVAQSADVSGLPSTPILDETGNILLDENSNSIYDEGVNDVVGSNNANALIACNNLIQVYEYSSYYPNGLLVFSGYISKWKAVFGADDNIIITAISNGQDLNNYLVLGGLTAEQTNTTNNSNGTMSNSNLSAKINQTQFFGQTFTVGAGIRTLSAIDVKLAGVGGAGFTFTVKVYNSVTDAQSGVTPLTSVSRIISSTTPAVYQFQFATPLTVTPSTQYFFVVSCQDYTDASPQGYIYYQNTDVYAGGQMYYQLISGGGGGTSIMTWTAGNGSTSTADLYFTTYYTTSPNLVPFVNSDPSTMMTTILSRYQGAGGLVSTPAAGYSNTGTLASYTFKTQTMIQAIQTIMGFSPATWYWYVDPATNILQFAQSNTVADFVFIKGRHINELDLEATRENIKNNVYFTGGDDGTGLSQNIFVQVQNALNNNRVGLALLSDNRVNSATGGVTTARLIAQAFANANNAETYITNVVIQDGTIDTTQLLPGKMIAFVGFSPFVNNLLLQVVGVQKAPDQVTLQLGTLPTRVSQAVANIEAGLAYQQTVANPATAS